MVDGLRVAAEQVGASIELNASVEAIERSGDTTSVRLKDGRVLTASAAVLATTPDIAAALTGSPTLTAVAKQAVQVRAACLDVGLRKLPVPDREFAFGLDTPLYYSVHSRAAKLGPAGAAVIHVAKYLAPDDTDAKAHEQQLEACMDLVQPGWRDEVVQRRYLPNMTVVPSTATPANGGLAARPAVDGTGIDNVYLAGDWVGAEGWLSDASASSAKRAAELVLSTSPVPATAAAPAPVPARA
jgi:phytoene dehydrogenase-like protein